MPNTIFLTFNQASLRLRHLTQVIGFNLNSSSDQKSFHTNPLPSYLPPPLIKNGYYFTLESSVEGKPNYTSEINPSSSPFWESFDSNSLFPVHLLSQKGIIIRVWIKENDQESPVTSWGVNFSGLVPLSSKAFSSYEYNLKTLIFKMKGRYYTSYDCLKNISKDREQDLFKLHHGCSLSLSETKPSYSVSSLCKFHNNKRTLRIQECKKENFKTSLYAKGVKNDSKRTIIEKKIEDVKIRICLLMEQLNLEMIKLSSLTSASENQDIANQDKGIELLEGYQTLNKQLSISKVQENKLYEDNDVLRDIVSKVRERRCQLLSHLHLIFPVESNSECKKYDICKIRLPDAECYDGHSDQSLSVGLGFVSQLIVKIAFLINIPLKYPINLRGSLSSISDLTSTQLSEGETLFPLHTRGKEREKLHFNYGVFLLNKNIAQLRWSCGLPTSDLRQTLYNVWHFLCNLHDMSHTPHAFMPDTIVPLPVLPVSLRQTDLGPSSFLQHQTPRLINHHQSSKTRYKSLPDTLSSPKNSFPKKDKSEDEYYSCSISDGEYKEEKHKSDETHSDVEVTLNSNKPINDDQIHRLKNESQKMYKSTTKLKPVSFSLDQGIDYIKNEKDGDFMRTFSLNSSLCSSNIPNSYTGSFPSLIKNPSEENTKTPEFCFHEQTTQLLKSWHENDPSPYHSIVTVTNYPDQLETLNTAEIPTSGKLRDSIDKLTPSSSMINSDSSHTNQRDVDELPQSESKKCISECEDENAKEEISQDENLINSCEENSTEKLVRELGLSLEDIGMDDDSLLKDVASRAANLASQNCSFKLSFSRQSPED